MTTRRSLLPTLATLALIAPAARADEVAGRVVDADGRPAVGAVVATHWGFEAGNPKVLLDHSATTDADGQFVLDVRFARGRAEAILARGIDEQTGGIRAVTPAEAKRGPIEIKLAPLVRVRGVVESEHPKYPVDAAIVLVLLPDNVTRVADAFSFDAGGKGGGREPGEPARYDLLLPPGDYLFDYYNPTVPSNHVGFGEWVKLRAEVPGLVRELRPARLPLAPHAARRVAGPPPLHVKAARGVARGVQLADYRGKWVVLDFWSVHHGLPEAATLWDDHADARDKFAVLAIHGRGADDLADLDRQLAPLLRDARGGRALPVPILLDDDGRTFEAFELEATPSTVVIDPDGKVAPGGLADLPAALAITASPRPAR